ncbi:MAG: efflux RND transporter periplasmic adaptor subunit [Polyangiaceae bacterium]
MGSSSSARWVLAGVGVLAIGAGAFFVRARRIAPEHGAPGAAASAERAIPVLVADVVRTDVPIVLEGLGTVTPLQSVSVQSQVDGPLVNVAFKEGDPVKKGDLLAEIDPRPFVIKVHQAEATLAKDQAQLKNAENTLKRNEALVQGGLQTQQQLDDQRALVLATAAGLKADQTALESARLQLDYARIRSPIDGVTGVRLVDPGNVVRAQSSTLVVVTQLDPMGVVFTLPQDELARVSGALARGPLAVDAVSRDGGKKLAEGKLLVVDNQINTTTGTLKLKASFPNPDKVLWPNAFVKARLVVSIEKDSLVVPDTVVQRGPDGPFAYVVDGDRAVVRPVEVFATQGGQAIVKKGLSAGERVVVDGQNQLKPGGKIVVRASGGAREAGAASARAKPQPRP